MKGYISVSNTTAAGAAGNGDNKKVPIENYAAFTDCISKINNTKTDNAKDIDVAFSMYNLIEYSNNFLKTPVLIDAGATDIFPDNSASVKCKQKITANSDVYGSKDLEIVVPLEYLSSF